MRKITAYNISDISTLDVKRGALLLSFHMLNPNSVFVYVEEDVNETATETWNWIVVKDANPFDPGEHAHVGTASNGSFHWHFYF